MRWDLPLALLVGILTSLGAWIAMLVAVRVVGVPGVIEALILLVLAVALGIWAGRRVRTATRARRQAD
jgi:putative effector of murein hydrolase LrgA (UPF0299 family)